jgi:Fe(3+) dicitrate transport protein
MPEETLVRNKALLVEWNINLALPMCITQAFRPVLFSDLTPPAVTDVIDPNLKMPVALMLI